MTSGISGVLRCMESAWEKALPLGGIKKLSAAESIFKVDGTTIFNARARQTGQGVPSGKEKQSTF